MNYYKNSDEKYEKSSAVGRYLRYLIDDGQAEKAEEILRCKTLNPFKDSTGIFMSSALR